MPHYLAFLRGINLGRRRLKMDTLRELFTQLGFQEVATFIASGNVSFSATARDSTKLERLIEAHLGKSLGYTVDTFVRTREELAAITAAQPFAPADLANPAYTINVGLFKSPLPAAQARPFAAVRTPLDEIRVIGREFYWLYRRERMSESLLWTLPEMRACKLPTSTMRKLATFRALAELHPAGPAARPARSPSV